MNNMNDHNTCQSFLPGSHLMEILQDPSRCILISQTRKLGFRCIASYPSSCVLHMAVLSMPPKNLAPASVSAQVICGPSHQNHIHHLVRWTRGPSSRITGLMNLASDKILFVCQQNSPGDAYWQALLMQSVISDAFEESSLHLAC